MRVLVAMLLTGVLSGCLGGVPAGWTELATPLTEDEEFYFTSKEVRRMNGPAGVRLFAPDSGRARAVVIIRHGCGGYSDSPYQGALNHVRFLNGKGIAAVVVDSYSGRGVTVTCPDVPAMREDFNFYGRFDIARAERMIRQDARFTGLPIFAMGMSNGGATVLQFSAPIQQEDFGVRLNGIIAYYPPCQVVSHAHKFKVPTIVLIGSEDDWTLASECEFLDRKLTGDEMELHVYAGATHSFDGTFTGSYLGHRMAADPSATADSQKRYLDFINRNL